MVSRFNPRQAGWKLPTTRAAVHVLREAGGGPLHYRTITSRILEQDLIASSSTRVERTIYSNMSKHIRERGEQSWFRHAGPGMYALTESGEQVDVWRSQKVRAEGPKPIFDLVVRTDLTWLEAVRLVLHEAGHPLAVREIVDRAWQQGLKPRKAVAWPYRGVGNELARAIRSAEARGEPSQFERVGPGEYGLLETPEVQVSS